MPEKYHPLVNIARNKLWGDSGLIRSEDWEGFFGLSRIDQARYIGARDNCNVVESLAKNPKYGPEYQVGRYFSVNFWYSYLLKEFKKAEKFEDFGKPVVIRNLGGIGHHDPHWVPKERKGIVRGPMTYHGYVLPRQIIDIANLSREYLLRLQKQNSSHVPYTEIDSLDFSARQVFLNLLLVIDSPSLDVAVSRLAINSRILGMKKGDILQRVFDPGYKKEMPEAYWKHYFDKVRKLLEESNTIQPL